MTASQVYVCDNCGKEVEVNGPLFLGRMAGHMIHTCSKRCFHFRVTALEKQLGDLIHK